jgi:hypothetical protein
MISEMPPPVAQRQAPTDSAVLHAVYTLADYPVLASIAAKRTQARKLDGRHASTSTNPRWVILTG